MKISTMQRTDRWLGKPLCFVLTVIHKCRNLLPFPQKSQPQKVKRILFVKLAEQGATILADAAIRSTVEIGPFLAISCAVFLSEMLNAPAKLQDSTGR